MRYSILVATGFDDLMKKVNAHHGRLVEVFCHVGYPDSDGKWRAIMETGKGRR